MNRLVLTRSQLHSVILLLFLFSTPSDLESAPQADAPLPGELPMIVAVHVPAWEVRMGSGTDGNYGDMPVDSIDYSVMTHYISFAAGIETTGAAIRWNNIVSSRRKPLNDRIHAAGKPALLCLGGAGSDSYFTKAFSASNRGAAVNTILSTIRTHGYDGIDWDWEPFSVSDSALLFPVIRALHDSFQTMNAAWDPSRRPIQTADINPAGGSVQANTWETIAPYLEFTMIMSYDKIGSWTNMVYFDYAPYSRINNVIVDRMPGGGQEMATAQRQALQMTEAGFPPEKVVIAIDFMAAMASGGSGTWAGGATWPRQRWATVPTFRNALKFDDFYQQYLDTASSAVRRWDDTAKAYFLSIDKPGSVDDKFISYAGGPGEDSTLYHHVKLARELGIGGIMVWDLSEAYLGTGKFPAATYPDIERNWLTHQLRKHLLDTAKPPPPPAVDSIAPSVAFISPADGDSLMGTVAVEATASDNVGVRSVHFLFDGAALGFPDSTAPYSILWDTELHTDTLHTLTAIAYDTAGLQGSATIQVRLTSPPPPPPPPPPDTVAPTVAFISPADGDSLLGNVTVEANASDNVAVSAVQFLLDGVALGSPDSAAPYAIQWNTELHPDGNYTLSAVASDTTGLKDTATIQVRLVSPPPPPPPPDTLAPTVAFISPADGDSLLGNVTVEANASDNVGVSAVQFLLDGVALGSPDSAAPYVIQWNTELFLDGIHTLSAVASDTTGLKDTATIQVRLVSPPPPPPDTLAPTVAFSSPADGDSLLGNVTVEANASDNVGVSAVQFLLDGVALGSPDSAAPYAIQWNTELFLDGIHTLSAVASDTTGLKDTATIQVRLISPPPPSLRLAYNRTSIDFGTVPISTQQTDSVTLFNPNSFTVNLTNIGASSPVFTVISPQMSVGPGTSIKVYITFSPETRTTFNAMLLTNAGTTIRVDTVYLSGTGGKRPRGRNSTEVADDPIVEQDSPPGYALAQNYPNPFNPVTTLRYSLPTGGRVRIAVYNMLGQEVAVPVDEIRDAGTWEATFDGSSLPSGAYTCRITADGFTEIRRMLLLR